MPRIFIVFALFWTVACSETPAPPVTDMDTGMDVDASVDMGSDTDTGEDAGEDTGDDCDRAAKAAGNAGCTFFAVDLDRFDLNAGNASAAWGLVVANVGSVESQLTVSRRTSAVGEALATEVIHEETLAVGGSTTITLPQAEIDCSETPGDQAAPGTCLSALGFRLDATTPVVAWQLNALQTSPHSEAALLLPLHGLGERYRAVTFNPAHPVRLMVGELVISRSTITIVGTAPDTTVTVAPTWRIRGTPPVAATNAGESLTVTLGALEVLQLESDDALLSDPVQTIGDLSGSTVRANRPIAVFAGTETSNVPGWVSIPTYPGWDNESCCPNHLAEQLLPDTVLGRAYAVGRSPVRSTSIFREADIVRFVGGDTASNIVTSLPAPFANFTLAPGEVRTTYTEGPFTAEGSTPFVIAQFTVAAGYVDGPVTGGPSMTFAPAVSNFTREATFALPLAWGKTFIVVVADADTAPLLDGLPLSGCSVADIGIVNDVPWQQHTCEVAPGIHTLRGDVPFGLTLHGINSTNAFSTPGALRLVAP
jgi:hypothetical protein